jgi:hypothetical protein
MNARYGVRDYEISFEDIVMTIITVKDVERALINTLGKKGMPHDECKKLAAYVMNFFGFEDMVSDNLLKARDRDVFYMLQDVGLLKTFQDQITIKKGKIWRIHYWVLKKRDILRLANLKDEVKKVDKYNIYQEMTDEMWVHDEKE